MDTWINELKKVSLKNPILISGLPGAGYVGKLAVEFLIEALGAEKFAELVSYHLPYYVLVDGTGRVRLLKGHFYYVKRDEGPDIVLLTGDSQAESLEGHYTMSEEIIKFAKKLGINRMIALAGFRSPCKGEKREVFAAFVGEWGSKIMKEAHLRPAAGTPVVGMAGILLAIAQLYGIDGLVLLGETRGYATDPEAAKSVLEILCKLLSLKLDFSLLEKEIEEAKGRREHFLRDLSSRLKLRGKLPSYIS